MAASACLADYLTAADSAAGERGNGSVFGLERNAKGTNVRNVKFIVAALALALCGCAIRPPVASAQFNGFTSPQSTAQTVFNAVNSAQTANIVNLGQTVHFLTYTCTSPALVDIRIDATIDGTTWFPISDDATDNTTGVVIATGFYPRERVNLVTYSGSGTLTAFYSGTSSVPANLFGSYNPSQQYRKVVFRGVSSDSIASAVISAPFGSTQGVLLIVAPSNLNAGATVTVSSAVASVAALQTFSYTLNEATTIFSLTVPPTAASNVAVTYNPGAAASTTLSAYYLFSAPGLANPLLSTSTHITGTTATSVTDSSGTLLNIAINTPANGTVSIFDLKSASCTGTPATNTVAVVTATSTQSPVLIPFNTAMKNGICVKASAGMDLTVGFQ